MTDKKQLIKQLYEAVDTSDYTTLEKILKQAAETKALNQTALNRVASRAISRDDVKVLATLMMHGYSIKKDLSSNDPLINRAAWNKKDNPDTLKFLYNLGYPLTKDLRASGYYENWNKWNTPLRNFISKKDSVSAVLAIQFALNERDSHKHIANAIAESGNHKYLDDISKKDLLTMANSYTEKDLTPFMYSIANSHVETARFFAKLHPEKVHELNEYGQSALTAYRISNQSYDRSDSETVIAVIDYLVNQEDLDINHKDHNERSFLFHTKEGYGIKPVILQEKRLLPFYLKCGMDIKEQFSSYRDYDLFPEYVDTLFWDKGYSAKTDRVAYASLADLILHHPTLPFDKINGPGKIFGKTFKHYIQNEENKNRADVLLKDPVRFCAEPAIASFIISDTLGLDKEEVNLDSKSFQNFKKKLAGLEDYQATPTTNNKELLEETVTDTTGYLRHVDDILEQFTKNIIYPTAIKTYGIDLSNVKDRDLLKATATNVLFGAFFRDKADFKSQTTDKVILLSNRYDVGVNYITAGLFEYTPPSEWMAYCDAVQAPNGKWIVPIISSTATKNAASTLSNCSFGQLDRFQTGEVIPFNVTDDPAVYQNLPALEMDDAGNITEYSEPLGYKNRKPNQATKEAWDWFVDQCKKGEIATNHKAFVKWSLPERAQRIALQKEKSQLSGYTLDEKWEEKNQTMFEAWQRVLGGSDRYRWRKIKDVKEFIVLTDFSETLADLAIRQMESQQKEQAEARPKTTTDTLQYRSGW